MKTELPNSVKILTVATVVLIPVISLGGHDVLFGAVSLVVLISLVVGKAQRVSTVNLIRSIVNIGLK